VLSTLRCVLCVVKVTVTRDPCSNSNSTGNDGGDVITVEVNKTALRDNRIYILVYKTICYLLFRAGGPLATLVVLNCRLLKTLRHQKRWRSSRQTVTSRVSAMHRQNVTAMLVSVVTVFIICELPDPALRLVYASIRLTYDPSDDVMLNLRYVNAVTNALLALNSSINFIIYFMVGRTFRRVFISHLDCSSGRRRQATAAADEASYVAMTTLHRHRTSAVKQTETRTLPVAKDTVAVASTEPGVNIHSPSIPGNCVTSENNCHNDQEHVTVVSVDVER